jgi:hypothetical protein
MPLAISTPLPVKAKGGMIKHPRWITPPVGCAKINVDAAVSRTGSGGSLEAVCRAANGLFLGASTLTVEGISDPSILEAMACREALALADLNLSRVAVASDCLGVITNLDQPFAGSYCMILKEIKETTKSFDIISFKHENRLSNSEAHVMARSVVASSVGRRVWLVKPPDGLCIPLNISIE